MRYAIKVRRRGALTFAFLGDNGSTSKLRIRAVTWTDREAAGRTLSALIADNPSYEAKIVPFDKPEARV